MAPYCFAIFSLKVVSFFPIGTCLPTTTTKRDIIILTMTGENLVLLYANNKGADQTAHPRSLISAFVFLFSRKNNN